MSNRRKIRPQKKPKDRDEKKLPPGLIVLKGKSTAIGNRIQAKINGAPDPNLHYPNIIVADDGHLLNNDINLNITYRAKRAVPLAFQNRQEPEKST
jgi:hypothetical protein